MWSQEVMSGVSGGSRGGGGGNKHAPPPLKFDGLWVFPPILYQNAKKNKAQIARESIKKTLQLPGPLSGP